MNDLITIPDLTEAEVDNFVRMALEPLTRSLASVAVLR